MKTVQLLAAVTAGAFLLSGCVTSGGQASTSVPVSCVEALDVADEAFQINAQAWGAATDSISALLNGDIYSVDQATSEMDMLTDELGPLADEYHEASAACRAGE
jgi:PBP1b-binding outer membrane lipoprotein LpoB